MLSKKFKEKVLNQKKLNLFRNPPVIDKKCGKIIYIENQAKINFASNDYLGLSSSQELKKSISANFLKYCASSASSRLVTGNFATTCNCEKLYAKHFGYDDALLFATGYQANLGLISALFDKQDIVLFDKHVHASCVKGLELSKCKFIGFNHASFEHLEKRLKMSNAKWVITESLFSMDGDLLDVEKLLFLKKKYNFFCIVDEAHSFGSLGDEGKGIANKVADIAIGTLGKAFGFFGAFVLFKKKMKDYLFNFSSPLIYSTCLPEAHSASAIEALDIIKKSEKRRKKLQDLSFFAKDELRKKKIEFTGEAHIIAIFIGCEKKALKISQKMIEKGFFVFSARFPTVPYNKAIIRMSLSSLHSKKDIKLFVENLFSFL